MDGGPLKHESDMDGNTSYVSKEKYTALANEIRKWEDDLWHTRRQKSRPRVSGSADKTPDGASKKSHFRESLSSVTPAHVSSLRQFWESLMTKETLNTVTERPPLRPIQPPTFSLEKRGMPDVGGVPACKENLLMESIDVGIPELPPPPVGIEEPLAPTADILADLPPPPLLPVAEEGVCSKSAGFIDLSKSPKREYFVPQCPSTTQPVLPHRYFSRPRLGAYTNSAGGGLSRGGLRNWPNCSNLNESPPMEAANAQLPRQRSVTFEPKPGSAPGDSEVEIEGELPNVSSAASSAPGSSSRGHSSVPNDPGERYKYVDGDSFGILESAARLANSADRLNRNCCRSRRSSSAAAERSTSTASDTDEVSSMSSSSRASSSDDDGSEGDSVNSEPTSNRPSFTATAALVSPSSSSRGRKSSDAPRRMSREASALLDFVCLPTPITRGGRLSRSNTEIAAAEAVTLRRLERMKDIADLITREKSLIMEISTELAELHSSAKAVATGKLAKYSSNSASVPVGEATLIDLNLRFLLACQRRQALLEELALLHKGSPVMVPPMRGEPLRARLQLHAVRVALKPLLPGSSSGSGGGYVVVGVGERLRTVDGGRPVKYHILAVLKCVGEGRIYHTQTVTLMRVADLPAGTVRGAAFVDLLADIDIVPLRPDFVINIEVYCLQTGGSGGRGTSTDRQQSSGLQTPVSRRTNISIMEKSPIISSAKKCGGLHMSSLLLSSKRRKYYVSQPKEDIDLSAAFTLLSSVSLRHHDDLLFGRLPCVRPGGVGVGDGNSTVGAYAFAAAEGQETGEVAGGGDHAEMPLYLDGLPRSSPLAGPLGFVDITVRLQSAVLKRGFLTVFDESGGMGVWTRCWCKLSVDQLVYWRYPEDEIEAAAASSSSAAAPISRLDLRRIVAPWAVQAPRKICVRANTLYMRSLVAVNPKMLLIDTTSSSVGEQAPTTGLVTAASILLRASPDYKWMEQRHLICADSAAEMESWLKQLNLALEVLQRWMPAHFARLARYDSGLTFTQSVAASVASRLKQW
ncbi:actin binding protein anillin [Echinococcus multilocularis]|uniref:Actin binding protein anillin n=1 Tax=Echinococcus multilocularis TaxID=6211 RepID=A0A087W077_ECHMU|nr:actin binding protein anillin [Echinococcus multilocularis]